MKLLNKFHTFQNVSFRYNENTPYIYKNLEFGMDLDTRRVHIKWYHSRILWSIQHGYYDKDLVMIKTIS